jgi:hypothetical protein
VAQENLLEVDELSLYFGDPYVINQYVTITLPKLGEVVTFGERQYYSMVQTLTAIPSEMKSQLWDMGLDWTQLTDFQLFMMMAPTLPKSQTSIIFGDLDFQALRPFENNENGTHERETFKNPDINIVAIDYDAGATAVNQENRIKLMLANSK